MTTRAAVRGLIGVLASVSPLACGQTLQTVTTTSHLAAIVRRIGGDAVPVTVLIPAGECPGHFDMRPGDRLAIEKGDLILAHGWETVLPQVQTATARGALHRIDVKGNWLVPSVQKEAARLVCAILSEKLPGRAGGFEANLRDYTTQMDALDAEARQRVRTAGLAGCPVICQAMIADFLSFLGLKVVATYGREEEMTPLSLAELVRTGRKEGVRLVVDNLQAGPKAGVALARELKVPRVTISNFPGGMPRTETVEACVRDNISRIAAAYGSRH